MPVVTALLVALLATEPQLAASAQAGTEVRTTSITAACPSGAVPPTWFTDLGRAHGPATACAHWQQIVFGLGPTRYGTEVDIRRDQIASVIARALDRAGVALPRPRDVGFTDIDGNVHAERISQLAQLGVVEGRSADRYAPKSRVTRAQAAAMLVRFHDLAAANDLPAAGDQFDDDDGTTHEATIDRAGAAGVIVGTGVRTFAPHEQLTRGQLATLTMRVVSRLVTTGDAPRYTDPAFVAEVGPLPADVRAWMTGLSWRSGCPVGLDDLRLVEMTHWGFAGDVRRGAMVVHHDVASEVVSAFESIYRARFRIERMRLVDAYRASDDASMADNNTSAFNCRRVTGGTRWSEHSYGRAIDINPVQNPYVSGSTVAPSAGRTYLDRSRLRLGMIVEGDPVVGAFDRIGWGWGGRWSGLKDYQHVSHSGR